MLLAVADLMFVTGRVGDVECPEVEDVIYVVCCCAGSEQRVGGGGQRKLDCSLQDQGSTSAGGILAGYNAVFAS